MTGGTLKDIAQQLKDSNNKVQLIYAFNGTGKTRLSREFKDLVSPPDLEDDEKVLAREKILYYNAFTEDLFYWDNDLEAGTEPKLKIQRNTFTDWILRDRGQDQNIISRFQRYTDEKLTPHFEEEFSSIRFSYERGNAEREEYIKLSKGEESNLIWSVFYVLLEEVISNLNVADPADRIDSQFDKLDYVFIDDPVSSLDENHLIELAVDLAQLIKSNQSDLKFIITTHSPLFYNVLCNELGRDDKSLGYKANKFEKSRLDKKEDGSRVLSKQPNDSPFSYHLHLLSEIQSAIQNNQLRKYHFNFLRNILEKNCTFLGYKKWGELLPQNSDGEINPYESRIINISSHSKHAGEEIAELTDDDKRVLQYLVTHLVTEYRYSQEVTPND